MRSKTRGVPYHHPDAVSALIMDQRTRPFFLIRVDTSRLQNPNPGLLPVPYHQITVTPNINMILIITSPSIMLNR